MFCLAQFFKYRLKGIVDEGEEFHAGIPMDTAVRLRFEIIGDAVGIDMFVL